MRAAACRRRSRREAERDEQDRERQADERVDGRRSAALYQPADNPECPIRQDRLEDEEGGAEEDRRPRTT